jgi:hypothetical protein
MAENGAQEPVMSHPLDLATTLAGDAADAIRAGHTSDAYWAFVGPFGGALAATVVRAVLERPERLGDPLALTVNFCAPLARGSYQVATRLARSNRSTQHWSIELTQADLGVVLTATLVTALRRDTWSHRPATPPELPPASDLPRYHNEGGFTWVDQYEFRFASGGLRVGGSAAAPASAHSALWLRDATPRLLDFVSLTAMSDAFFGRVFQVLGQIVPFGTVSMTTYFHASGEELAAQGTAPLRAQADARVFHRSFGDQSGELWSEDGRLLATAFQIAYFRA